MRALAAFPRITPRFGRPPSHNRRLTAMATASNNVQGRVQRTAVLTSSTPSWTAPLTTVMVKMTGAGQPGTSSGSHYEYDLNYYSQDHTIDNSTGQRVGSFSPQLQSTTRYANAPTPPGESCFSPVDLGNGFSNETCHFYEVVPVVVPDDPTNGQDVTLFGFLFPGGVGGPASAVSYNNAGVIPGRTYATALPSGASITLTYFE